MAPDNSEMLVPLADLLRATDRQTEINIRNIDGLRVEMRQTAQETNARVEENQLTAADVIRRLEVLESIVLNKAS